MVRGAHFLCGNPEHCCWFYDSGLIVPSCYCSPCGGIVLPAPLSSRLAQWRALAVEGVEWVLYQQQLEGCSCGHIIDLFVLIPIGIFLTGATFKPESRRG